MTVLALVLLLLAAAAPLLAAPARRLVADPVLPLALTSAVLLGAAAAVAARTDGTEGWRLAAALVLGVVVSTTAGSNVVRAVFRLMRREFLPARTRVAVTGDVAAGGADADHSDAESRLTTDRPETVLRGGAWIGYLERAAVTSTVLAGWPEGVALVLAVKGVGRYSELRETNAPEAFIIGTFASMLWAVAAAGTAELLR